MFHNFEHNSFGETNENEESFDQYLNEWGEVQYEDE